MKDELLKRLFNSFYDKKILNILLKNKNKLILFLKTFSCRNKKYECYLVNIKI